MPDPHTRVIEDVYRAFNARDVEGVLVHFAPEVDWPNAETGGRIVGRVDGPEGRDLGVGLGGNEAVHPR